MCICQHTLAEAVVVAACAVYACPHACWMHTSAYVSQHTSAYVSIAACAVYACLHACWMHTRCVRYTRMLHTPTHTHTHTHKHTHTHSVCLLSLSPFLSLSLSHTHTNTHTSAPKFPIPSAFLTYSTLAHSFAVPFFFWSDHLEAATAPGAAKKKGSSSGRGAAVTAATLYTEDDVDKESVHELERERQALLEKITVFFFSFFSASSQ